MGRLNVQLLLTEAKPKKVEGEINWQLAPNDRGIPTPAQLFPGGTLTFDNKRLGGRFDSLSASIIAENF